MEIGELKPQTRELEILHPGTNENLGVRLTILSMDDPKMKRVKRSLVDDRLNLEQKGKHLKAEGIDENLQTILLAAILGWVWYNPIEGDESKHPKLEGDREPEFCPRNVKKLLDHEWFRDQVNAAISDRSAFY